MANFSPNVDLVQGKRYQIWISETSGATPSSGSIIAYGTSCELSVDADTVEASSKFMCGWRAASVGTAGYTVQTDSLFTMNTGATSFATLMDMMINAEGCYWYMGEEQEWSGTCETNTHLLDSTKVYFSGQGIPTSLSLSASADDFVQCSCTITGTGEIEVHK